MKERKLILSLIILVMIPIDHFLVLIMSEHAMAYWFGFAVPSLITDACLLSTLILHMILIIWIERDGGEKRSE